MSGKQTLFAAIVIALSTAACATHKIHYKNTTAGATGQTHEAKQSFFLWGLVGGSEVDLDKLCPGGVAGIESKSSGVDSVLTYVTAGLYSPMSVEVRCAAAGTPVATEGAR